MIIKSVSSENLLEHVFGFPVEFYTDATWTKYTLDYVYSLPVEFTCNAHGNLPVMLVQFVTVV